MTLSEACRGAAGSADSAPPARTLLRAVGLEVGYRGVAVLPPLELEVMSGEFLCVVGRNGAGKTTLLRSMLGRLPPVAGQARLGSPPPRLGYLAQRSGADEAYPLLARDVVRLGMERGWSFATLRLGARREVEAALAELGVAELGDRPYRTLSEGQKQRVLVARLVASRAELAWLDEPTSAMDVVAEREVFGLLDAARRRHGLALLVVCHDLAVAAEFADRLVFVDAPSRTVLVGPPREVLRNATFRGLYGLE